MAQFYFGSETQALRGYYKCYIICGVLATVGAILPLPVAAQQRDGRALQQAYRQIERTCGRFTQRLCPALQESLPSARNQAICLKSFKSSLSLPCRAAVTAATG